VRTLALKLGFGGTYAEEICERAKVEKSLDGISANLGQLKSLFKAVQAVIAESREIKNAIILFKEGEPVDFSPIKLKKFKGETKKYGTFSEACDEFYVKFQIEEAALIKTNQVDKYERILEEQKSTLERLKLEIPEFKKKGDDLSMKQDFKQAQKFYEKYKKDKKKIDGLKEAIAETKKKMKDAENIEFQEEAPKKKIEQKKEWYEKFRWFKSSDGFLVIGGKDATSNEIVVKKHTEPHDLVFHADIVGAPFCIIKTNGKDVPETTLEETAQFAASYSKAWPRGLGTVDVYYIRPEQVSKEAPAGEHIGKGAFMIYGKKTYFRNVVLRIAVGLDSDANVISGPESSVKERSVDYLLISPGREKAGELAKKLKAKFLKKAPESFQKKIHKIPNSDFQKFIPAGKGKIITK
jgi:predicted ribosome quality control (RQC) complex YloA/Tae2 family protein